MPEEKKKNKADAPKEGEATKKGLPIKAMGIFGGVLLVEAVVIVGIFMFAGGPSPAAADGGGDLAVAEAERLVEVEIADEKFQNTRSGRTYFYDTTVHAVVKEKDQEAVTERLERMRASVLAEIDQVFRRAEPAQLHEFELATVRRQITAALNDRLGKDPEGEPYLQDLIVRTTELRADF